MTVPGLTKTDSVHVQRKAADAKREKANANYAAWLERQGKMIKVSQARARVLGPVRSEAQWRAQCAEIREGWKVSRETQPREAA